MRYRARHEFHRAALVLIVNVAILATAAAAMVDTPRCRADLARANTLISAIDARTNSVPRDDVAGTCALLRRNRTEMRQATEIMQRCMTGHDQRENVGQMAASLGDIEMVLARRCR